ncbi:hypothetical protein CDL12_14766 [Handroanthus impetiginosus]|uniref:PsbQ-like protein 3, chloroplastic n=1 Tax=Handroanthus impetiginosus TaxID=429701 RepID=A0A2G9H548_9LAMI|nr:hypothetical protein CDL12_14766 [Handroanthus impetiginosus]
MKICIIHQRMATTPSLLQTLNPPIKPHRTTTSTTAVAAVARRSSIILTSLFLSTQPIFTNPGTAFDFRLTVPDQTIEEARSGIESHAQSLLKVKDLLMAESWKEAQKSLRKSSSLLKQDIYTIIQAKPSSERPRLRKLYADLFNGVTKLDYAARDKDRIRVWDCYESIVSSLDGILSRI